MKIIRLRVVFSALFLISAAAAVFFLLLPAIYLRSRAAGVPTAGSAVVPVVPLTETALSARNVTPTDGPQEWIGAPGIGDPYFPLMGNGGYDVLHYDLDLDVDMKQQRIEATAVLSARTTQPLASFNLDLVGFTVQDVQVNGVDASFVRSGGELAITPAEALPEDSAFTVSIRYAGVPEDDSKQPYLDGWSFYEDGVLVAGEPTGAENWFPVNNHPLDKAAYRFAVTVPDPYLAAANGLLVNTIDNGDGTRTFVWQSDDPMAPYLATVAVGDFTLLEDVTDSGVPVRNYVASGLPADAEQELTRIPEIIGFFETVFGPYPFDACGVVMHDLPLWFALENQTLVVTGIAVEENIIVHEMAHMWFGDSISLTRWQDIWLNEGFASYGEVLWLEYAYGRANADENLERRYRYLVRMEENLLPIGDPGPEDLFDLQVYHRGALTLHALRLQTGDEVFFRILKTYAERFKDGNAATEDFVAVAEEISGTDLDAFFDRWLNQAALPDIPEMGFHPADFR